MAELSGPGPGPATGDAEAADLWVFGYGSLMWRPGFPYRERRHARLNGYHRALCVFSHVHRGTPQRPGLVLGLDRGGRCHGVAFQVAAEEAAETVAYLRAREQVTGVYVERRLPVRLDGGGTVEALTYVVDRRHPQYAGRLPEDELLRLVRQGVGVSGANPDYVRQTHAHLVEMGVTDPVLAHLAQALTG
jgi:cation transport protein ChaC